MLLGSAWDAGRPLPAARSKSQHAPKTHSSSAHLACVLLIPEMPSAPPSSADGATAPAAVDDSSCCAARCSWLTMPCVRSYSSSPATCSVLQGLACMWSSDLSAEAAWPLRRCDSVEEENFRPRHVIQQALAESLT